MHMTTILTQDRRCNTRFYPVRLEDVNDNGRINKNSEFRGLSMIWQYWKLKWRITREARAKGLRVQPVLVVTDDQYGPMDTYMERPGAFPVLFYTFLSRIVLDGVQSDIILRDSNGQLRDVLQPILNAQQMELNKARSPLMVKLEH